MAAATKLVPHGSALLETDEDILQNQRQVSAMAQGLRQYNPGFFDAMSDFMTETSAVIREHRFEMTLQALDELTRSMSGFRGRKNVIWLSEYFPVSFGVMTDNGRFSNLRNYDDLISSTASVLSSSQVAIYPIDVRGITGGFFGNASLPGGPADSVREIGNIEGRHVGMDEIAEQTGGHAYYNTNGLKFAMQRSLESGSEYYTLAYVPPRGADSKYHHIKIRMVRRGLTSEYRRGYFAMPTKPSVNAALDFAGAVQPATPVSNGLLLRARLLLPDQQNANTRVDCTIAAENLTFLDQPNHRKLLKLNLLTVAWDGYLNPVANVSNTVELRFSPEQYERVLRDGVTVHQELSLKRGKYDLRLAVMDDGSHRIGTLDVPVEMSARNVAATK